ncbi:MAG TPA: RNA 2',3'-cyclic phosphodiesterase [Permianibacter sp.]|nr:RNA 2',3'-cyclic phosphodiesterase [Permianibacter sp.]
MAQTRVFFALPVPQTAALALDRWRRQLPLVSGRWVPVANFHLTLAFLGELADDLLDALLDDEQLANPRTPLPPFTLEFGELGYFTKPKVLFVAPREQPDALLALARHCQQLQGRYGSAKKEHRYQPHITLARDVEPPVPPAAAPLALTLGCQHYCLMASHNSKDGVRYQTLARWPLRRPLRPQPRD